MRLINHHAYNLIKVLLLENMEHLIPRIETTQGQNSLIDGLRCGTKYHFKQKVYIYIFFKLKKKTKENDNI